jgi:hypothetical protein
MSLKILKFSYIEVQADRSIIAATTGDFLVDECVNQSFYRIRPKYAISVCEYDYISLG